MQTILLNSSKSLTHLVKLPDKISVIRTSLTENGVFAVSAAFVEITQRIFLLDKFSAL